MTSKRWFIVTNTENLKFFYDCGLIVDRQAFPDNSYMFDMQAKRPKGFLPCFSIDNLADALKLAKSEDQNLISCLVEIEFNTIGFEQIYVKTRNPLQAGEFKSVSKEGFTESDVNEILLPAPLPLGCIKNIFLSDAKVQKEVVQEFTAAFGEFPSKFFNNNAKIFNQQNYNQTDFSDVSNQSSEVPLLNIISERELNYTKAFAYGGVLALGYYQTKNGRLSSELFEMLANNSFEKQSSVHLLPLVDWVLNHQNQSELNQFYALIFDLIAGEDDLGTVRYDLLQLFKNKEKLPPGYAHVSGLAVRLQELVDGIYPETLDVYFPKLIQKYEENVEGYSKIFLLISMIFIRDHSETMLKFYHKQFTEEDYFLLAVFFGLIMGTGKTPFEIKSIVGLRDWVSFKMAEFVHKTYASSITFEKEPSSPVLIHKKYFKKTSVSKKQDALQKFCQNLKFEEADIIEWVLATKQKYTVESGNIIFSKRPSLYAVPDNKRLEQLMLVKSIKETDELFNFNKALDIFKD